MTLAAGQTPAPPCVICHNHGGQVTTQNKLGEKERKGCPAMLKCVTRHLVAGQIGVIVYEPISSFHIRMLAVKGLVAYAYYSNGLNMAKIEDILSEQKEFSYSGGLVPEGEEVALYIDRTEPYLNQNRQLYVASGSKALDAIVSSAVYPV